MKTVKISGVMEGETVNYNRIKLTRVEATCSECGGKTVPEKPFGTIFVPKAAGVPEQIVITLVGEKK